MVNVSVLILARNEEENIVDCIRSCQFAQEIVVIDDNSTDKTVSLAKAEGALVYTHALAGDWGQQQTYGIQQCSHEWIFMIDADERCTPELQIAIAQMVANNEPYACWIERKNAFHHNQATHGVLRPDYVCRLMPKKGTYVEGFVHPAIITPYKNKKIKGTLLHYTYDNWEQYFRKFNQYTTLAANKYKEQGKSCSFIRDIMIRPAWAFFKMYILDKGFLDGKMGWILSVDHYFYTMNKYVKLYYLYKSNGKL